LESEKNVKIFPYQAQKMILFVSISNSTFRHTLGTKIRVLLYNVNI